MMLMMSPIPGIASIATRPPSGKSFHSQSPGLSFSNRVPDAVKPIDRDRAITDRGVSNAPMPVLDNAPILATMVATFVASFFIAIMAIFFSACLAIIPAVLLPSCSVATFCAEL
jgi:hypothetical protein